MKINGVLAPLPLMALPLIIIVVVVFHHLSYIATTIIFLPFFYSANYMIVVFILS